MPRTIRSGLTKRSSTERLKLHKHNMTRLRTRRKKLRRKNKNKSLLTWNLTHGKRVPSRRITPPQATTKTMKISLGLGLVLPVSGMKCDPCLRDRGG